MNPTTVKKVALSFALLSFILLSVGSFMNGARLVTACLRGVEGFVIFGLLAWGVGSRLLARMETHPELDAPGEGTSENIDQTA